jgi:ribonucleoside-diphosphate reductase alpha chain
MPTEFSSPISRDIWEQKYQFKREGEVVDLTLDATFERVARSAAAAERTKVERDRWARAFHEVMAGGAFLPAGRILAGAGTDRNVTLFNCFVLGRIDDDLSGIFDAVKEAALTMQAGGGIGHDFSTLRPRGAPVRGVSAHASGPVSFMDVWDAMCATIMSAGQRRGAMMATLRCDHPDILEFIAAKSQSGRLSNFNLSVLVTDAFIAAVKANAPFDLVFEGTVYRTLPARELFAAITRANYAYAEPGVIFIDRVNAANNLSYCETIAATNPCGEQPLPPYGACLLGSINLAALVLDPFTGAARLDMDRLSTTVATAVRLLDNMIDVSRYPLPAQAMEARSKRRIGLGITGLADALICLSIPYGTNAACAAAGGWMQSIQQAAYLASSALAAEKGSFALFDAERFLTSSNVDGCSAEVRAAIARQGIRNGCLTSIAPTGTISLLAGNVSSGIEPVFDFTYRRRLRGPDGDRDIIVEDYAHALYRRLNLGAAPSGPAWVAASDLTPHQHLAMQAALQPHVDSAISKTINCPQDIDATAFDTLYLDAYDLGLKGCTTFRPNAITGSILTPLTVQPGADEPAKAGNSPLARVPRSTAAADTPDTPAQSAAASFSRVIAISDPLVRGGVLTGETTEIKGSGLGPAVFVTINDIVRDGRRRPYEIFINTQDLSLLPWTTAVSRLISAVFRRGGDVAFVASELKAVFDPSTGATTETSTAASLPAAIGAVVERHLAGFEPRADVRSIATVSHARGGSRVQPIEDPAASLVRGQAADRPGPYICSKCSSPRYRREGGCRICMGCGLASCGD